MAFSNNSGSGKPNSEINVVPLVDVMLVLLIIFMVTTPLMSHKVEIELPETDFNRELLDDKAQAPPPITIAVTSQGNIFYNDEQVTLELIEARLSSAAQLTPQPPLNIRGDRTTEYRFISEVVNIAQAQGMRKVGYISLPEKK